MHAQQKLPFEEHIWTAGEPSYYAALSALLSGDLDFHDGDSKYASHNFHSFPAKFPPQLPRQFIRALTHPGECVYDPMMGSGTTLVEALLLGRCALGSDIDPLAVRIARVKTQALDLVKASQTGYAVVQRAYEQISHHRADLEQELAIRWDQPTREFVNYWFLPQTQLELLALLKEIALISDATLRAFLELVVSAVIITKSGGVSLALDLAHTRPHRAKIVKTPEGHVLYTDANVADTARARYVTKVLRSPLVEFGKRLQINVEGLSAVTWANDASMIVFGNAESAPLADHSVDLIVTSPPYASNAIDYMRAHKFSLVWLGHGIQSLGETRGQYVGGEAISTIAFEPLPPETHLLVSRISLLDRKKGQVLHRYYSEMTRVLREMYRVLKPGKAAIVVVGSSVMRGIDTVTQDCLAEIGAQLGFAVPHIGVRRLDRDRRMMPAGNRIDHQSQIQQRMHEEFVIGFYKPDTRNKMR